MRMTSIFQSSIVIIITVANPASSQTIRPYHLDCPGPGCPAISYHVKPASPPKLPLPSVVITGSGNCTGGVLSDVLCSLGMTDHKTAQGFDSINASLGEALTHGADNNLPNSPVSNLSTESYPHVQLSGNACATQKGIMGTLAGSKDPVGSTCKIDGIFGELPGEVVFFPLALTFHERGPSPLASPKQGTLDKGLRQGSPEDVQGFERRSIGE